VWEVGVLKGITSQFSLFKFGQRTEFLTEDDWYHDSASFFKTNQCLIQRLVRCAFLLSEPDLRTWS
jgi:hypothetical protein